MLLHSTIGTYSLPRLLVLYGEKDNMIDSMLHTMNPEDLIWLLDLVEVHFFLRQIQVL